MNVAQFQWPEEQMAVTDHTRTLKGVAVGMVIRGQAVILVAASPLGVAEVERALNVPIDTNHVIAIEVNVPRNPKPTTT